MHDIDKRWLVILAVVLILVFFAGVKYANFCNSANTRELPVSSDVAEKSDDNTATGTIEVYVSGQVKNPGVYKLKEGSRVHEAVDAAGGVNAAADVTSFNMAAALKDGQSLLIPLQGANLAVSSTPAGNNNIQSPGGEAKINLNTADVQELDKLKGIGPALAQRIVDYRKDNGLFNDIEDLKNVSGIGDKKFETIKDSICTQ